MLSLTLVTYRCIVIDIGHAESVILFHTSWSYGVKVIDADGNVETQGLGFVVKGLQKLHVARRGVNGEEIFIVPTCK